MAIPFNDNIELNATPSKKNHVITYNALSNINGIKVAYQNDDQTKDVSRVDVNVRHMFPLADSLKVHAGMFTAEMESIYEDKNNDINLVLDQSVATVYNHTQTVQPGDVVIYRGSLFQKNDTASTQTNPPLYYFTDQETGESHLIVNPAYTKIKVTDITDALDVRVTALENGGGGSSYTLPTASAGVLGGIMVGSGLSIDGSGVLSTTYSYTLPVATSNDLGGVVVGTGLAVTAGGTISVPALYNQSKDSGTTTTIILEKEKTVYKVSVSSSPTFVFTAPTGYSTGSTITFELIVTATATVSTITWPNVTWLAPLDNADGTPGTALEPTGFKQGYTYYLVFRSSNGTNWIGNVQGTVATTNAQ